MIRKNRKLPSRAKKHKITLKKYNNAIFKKDAPMKAKQILGGIIPLSLYRYRPLNISSKKTLCPTCSTCENTLCQKNEIDRLISMIEMDDFTLRLSRPLEFNDPYDTFIPTFFENQLSNNDELIQFLITFICQINILKNSNYLDCENDLTGIPSEKYQMLASKALSQMVAKDFEMPQIDEDTYYQLHSLVEKATEEYFDDLRHQFSNQFQENLGIACFSEDVRSILMWSHYAENHTGFCLEYPVININQLSDYQNYHGLYPVQYNNKLSDQTDKFLEMGKNHSQELTNEIEKLDLSKIEDFVQPFLESGIIDGEKIALFKEQLYPVFQRYQQALIEDNQSLKITIKLSTQKSTVWEYEKEWRLILPLNPDPNEEERLEHIKPSAIYFGTKTPESEVQRVKEAILESGSKIQVKKMRMRADYFQLDVIDIL